MIRVVLAVLLATAILGAAHHAAERGGRARADALLRDEATAVAGAADRLAARNDAGAARTLTVRVPERRWGRPPATISVGDDVGWQIGNRTGAVETGVRLDAAAGRLRLGAGRHRLRLTLVERGRGLVVRVRRFMAEHGTTGPHVRTRTRASVSV